MAASRAIDPLHAHPQAAKGMDPTGKYRPYLSYLPVSLPNRKWPDATIQRAPIWCSVDLRDGNQALINPMDLSRKLRLYDLLIGIGFKQIEVGFPSANDVEFGFTRHLIEQGRIPVDVIPQVLTQARPPLIRRTFEAIRGARSAIVHVYNPTSESQRRLVYRTDANGVRATAVNAVRLIRELAAQTETAITLEYSPESFTGTELEVALDVCNAVVDAWEPRDGRPLILNLPATVELATPNVYADQIEWMCTHINRREHVVVSLHTHNDRGSAVAATELGLMAGADRVEGTLFGNGERTGNVDIVTLALNLYSQGIDPGLDLRDIKHIAEVASQCTQLPIHERHPYAGRLVFTAFSGSHQFAIDRGLVARSIDATGPWDVPYLPIDPGDIGRDYTADAIRINNQSGGYGVAHVLRLRYDWHVPKELSREFTTQVVKPQGSGDITESIGAAFRDEYIKCDTVYRLVDFRMLASAAGSDETRCRLVVEKHGDRIELEGSGPSVLAACRDALLGAGCGEFEILSCHKHSTSVDAELQVIAYVQIETEGRTRRFGVGIDANANRASVKGLLSALNRVHEHRIYGRTQFRGALEAQYHCKIPAEMQAEFESLMDRILDKGQAEVPAEAIWQAFLGEFVDAPGPFEFLAVTYRAGEAGEHRGVHCEIRVRYGGAERTLSGSGGGTVESCVNALRKSGCPAFDVDCYDAYSLGETSDARGISFLGVKMEGRGRRFGAGIDKDTTVADARALVSALNRGLQVRSHVAEDLIDLMPRELGSELPPELQQEFVTHLRAGMEPLRAPLCADDVRNHFYAEFVNRERPYAFREFRWLMTDGESHQVECDLVVNYDGEETQLKGSGVGTVDACRDALLRGAEDGRAKCPPFRLLDLEEHSMGAGADARAIAYIPIEVEGRGIKYGVGVDRDVTSARIKALLAAVNRSFSKLEYFEHEFVEAMRAEFGCEVPEAMFPDFFDAMKGIVRSSEAAVLTADIWHKFSSEYLRRDNPFTLIRSMISSDPQDSQVEECQLEMKIGGQRRLGVGRGKNIIEACREAIQALDGPEFEVVYYGEHALRSGARSEVVSYVQLEVSPNRRKFGVGISSDSDCATIEAVVSALNRLLAEGDARESS